MSDMCGGNLLLKVGYWFYVNTRFGRWYFNRSIAKIESSHPLGHSAQLNLEYGDFHVCIVPYSKDNYGYIIWRDTNSDCIIVDPGYFPPFASLLSHHKLTLNSVLITHKHYDHCGSVDGIKALYPNVKIYAHARERIKACTHPINLKMVKFNVCDEDDIASIEVTAYHTPGHTVGHIIYSIDTNYQSSTNQSQSQSLLVFSGDSIFLGSIGAMFEGSLKENIDSLNYVIQNLLSLKIPADNILFFPGHEYAIDSLQFIVYNCTPFSTYAKKKLSWCEEQRNWLLPTIPTTLFDELSYSPYLRVAISTIPGHDRTIVFKIVDKKREIYYLPHVVELIHELLLTEKFVKQNSQKKELDIEILKQSIFLDLFSGKKKMLLRCEKCAPAPFTFDPLKSTLPSRCTDNDQNKSDNSDS